MAATGENRWPPVGRIPWPPSAEFPLPSICSTLQANRNCRSVPVERRYAEAQPRNRCVDPLGLFGCLVGACRRGLPKEFL
jgi:hypothetical protein